MATTQRAPGLPKKQPSNVSVPRNVKKKATETAKPAKSHPEEAQTETNETAGEYDNITNADAEEEEEEEEEEDDEGTEAIPAGSVNHNGEVVDDSGKVIGKVTGEHAASLEGSMVDQEGDVLDEEGNIIGQAKIEELAKEAEKSTEAGDAVEGIEKPEGVDAEEATKDVEKPELAAPFGVQDNGEITNASGAVVGKLTEGSPQELVGTAIKEIDADGHLKAESGSTVGKADIKSQLLDKAEGADELESQVSKPSEKLDEESVSGSKAQEKLDDASVHPDDAASNLAEDHKPEDATSQLPEDAKPEDATSKLEGADDKAADATSEFPDENKLKEDGTELSEATELPDLSTLKGKKVNKAGKIVDDSGAPFGVLVEGDPKKLIGKKVDDAGRIWNDSGKVIGRAELLPEDEREPEASGPFEDFPDSIVDKSGNVIFEGKVVGKLIEGDAKKLEGKKVDPDGDVVDKNGNVLGKAERFQEEDVVPEVEEKVDLSALEGKKVNKAGNVVDDNGKLFGRVATGELAKLVGKKVDAEGKIWSESGKVIGTAELLSVDDRDEISGAPFEDFPDAIVDKNGKVIYEGEVVGKLIEGDAKKLAGKKVDKDGEVLDKIGNVLGKAERWTEEEAPEPEKVDNSALAGKRVNKVGNVVDSHGTIYGKLVEGDAKKLAGKMCDKNGNVWSEGGDIVGRAELVPESEREGQKEGPFSGFSSPTVTKDGTVADSKGAIIGRLIEGEAKKLYGKEVDPDGDVLDKNGNSIGKAERWEPEEKEKVHNPVAGRKVNKEGNVVDENGDLIAKLTEGEATKCSGKEIDEDGDVYNGKGQVIGHVTLLEDIPEPVAEPEPEAPQETPEEIAARQKAEEEEKKLEEDKKLAKRMSSVIGQALDRVNPILKDITSNIDHALSQKKEDLDEQKLVDTVKPLIEQGGAILTETNGAIRALDPDGRISANAKQKAVTREATPEEAALAESLKELTGNVTQTIESAKKKIAGMPHAKKELNPLWGLLAEPLGQILAAVGLLLSGVLGLVGRLLSGLGLGGLLDNLLGGLGIKGILKGLGLGMVTESLTGRK